MGSFWPASSDDRSDHAKKVMASQIQSSLSSDTSVPGSAGHTPPLRNRRYWSESILSIGGLSNRYASGTENDVILQPQVLYALIDCD